MLPVRLHGPDDELVLKLAAVAQDELDLLTPADHKAVWDESHSGFGLVHGDLDDPSTFGWIAWSPVGGLGAMVVAVVPRIGLGN
jgi:hypothetical protein